MTPVDPRTAKHLISDQGEYVIDEVRKHWAALVAALLEMLGGLLLTFLAVVVPKAWWLPVLLGIGVMVHAGWLILDRRRDHFVITNMRVFRIHGVLSEHVATMPLSRILDITVDKPFVGRIFGFGHFVFESAAQAQGLRDIRYVGDPDARGLTIQRVVQQAGLRGYAGQRPIPSDELGLPMPPPPPPPPASEHDTEPLAAFDPDDTSTDPIRLPH
jgi:hypothetical protein